MSRANARRQPDISCEDSCNPYVQFLVFPVHLRRIVSKTRLRNACPKVPLFAEPGEGYADDDSEGISGMERRNFVSAVTLGAGRDHHGRGGPPGCRRDAWAAKSVP